MKEYKGPVYPSAFSQLINTDAGTCVDVCFKEVYTELKGFQFAGIIVYTRAVDWEREDTSSYWAQWVKGQRHIAAQHDSVSFQV